MLSATNTSYTSTATMSNQPQSKKTRFLWPSAIRNSLKSFRSHLSSSGNAAQTQTGQSMHESPSGTTSPVMSRSVSPEGHNGDVQSSSGTSVAVVGSSNRDKLSSLPGIYPSLSLVGTLMLV